MSAFTKVTFEERESNNDIYGICQKVTRTAGKNRAGKWDGGIMNRLQSQAISSCLNMFAYADTFVF